MADPLTITTVNPPRLEATMVLLDGRWFIVMTVGDRTGVYCEMCRHLVCQGRGEAIHPDRARAHRCQTPS